MRKNPDIRESIDAGLSGVHFDQQDMRRVLRAVRSGNAPRRVQAKRSQSPLRLALAACMMVMVLVPLSLFALRARHAQVASIRTITADGTTAAPSVTLSPGRDVILTPASPLPAQADDSTSDGVFDERDVLRIARQCFEAQCDTDVFSFDEYDVAVIPEGETDDSGMPASYAAIMTSIYKNGCSFRVVVSAPDGEVLSYSTPRLATVPMFVDTQSPEIRAWYDQYGAHLFAWPLQAQAEFSRRYEGAALRMPRESEASEQDIADRLMQHIQVSDLTDDPGVTSLNHHIMLYSERASADGVARYQVYVFAGDTLSDPLPPKYALITFRASDGEFESRQILSTSGL